MQRQGGGGRAGAWKRSSRRKRAAAVCWSLSCCWLLALAGGAFAYVKFIKPKQGMKVSADPDDYDFEDEEMVNEDEQEDTE